MKIFIKTLLFVFITLITNPKVVLSANVAFLDIQETTTSLSFHKETPKTVFMVIENDWVNRCQNEQDFVTYRGQGAGVEVVAAKTGGKLLNQFNRAESLIQGTGNLTKVKAGMQGFVKGDGASIFKTISQNTVGRTTRGGYILGDGNVLFNHFSTKTGIYTIDIHKVSGEIFKIRVIP